MWVELVIWLSGLPVTTTTSHHRTLFSGVLPASLQNCEHLAGGDWTSVAFLSPTSLQHLAQSWHSIQSVGKHGVICVYRDQNKIPTQHWGSPTASLLEYLSEFSPTVSRHKSSMVDMFCTCPHWSSCSLLLLFSNESCPPCGACLKPHPFLVLSLFGLPSSPYQQPPSATR